MAPHPIILFDGVCNLCNGAVQFVLKHDPEKQFMFASLQSEAGKQLLESKQLSSTELTSFILIENGELYSKSTAALKVAKRLNGAIKFLGIFIVIPAIIRDAVYNLIARNRYRWFGKKDACMMPTPELQSRFLK